MPGEPGAQAPRREKSASSAAGSPQVIRPLMTQPPRAPAASTAGKFPGAMPPMAHTGMSAARQTSRRNYFDSILKHQNSDLRFHIPDPVNQTIGDRLSKCSFWYFFYFFSVRTFNFLILIVISENFNRFLIHL